VPEVPHASVHFDGAELGTDGLLPGDGYEAHLKPFRTLEYLHVQGALLGYLFSVAVRARWPRTLREELLAVVSLARSLGDAEPLGVSTHLALAGLLSMTSRLLGEGSMHWASVEAPERERFERDRPLLEVAAKAREARRLRAWELVGLRLG
jgi:hypothetical protein